MIKHVFVIGAVIAALALTACTTEPTARNPNGTLALLGSGNYVYHPSTGSYSRFSSDATVCQEPKVGTQAAGCAATNGDAGGSGGAGH